jgi:hypothetical protein
MCIASPILVTSSINGSQNVYCVSDYCQRLWHMYSSIQESRRPDVKWHLYILPGVNVPVIFRMKIKISKSRLSLLISGIICLIYWRIKYLKLKYGLLLLKIHEKYKKYIFCIIFSVSLIKNDKQTKKGKEINIFKSLARSNVFSTKSEEQEVNLVWPNLCIFWLLFIYLYRSWSLPNFVWMNISGYQNTVKCIYIEFVRFFFTIFLK